MRRELIICDRCGEETDRITGAHVTISSVEMGTSGNMYVQTKEKDLCVTCKLEFWTWMEGKK